MSEDVGYVCTFCERPIPFCDCTDSDRAAAVFAGMITETVDESHGLHAEQG